LLGQWGRTWSNSLPHLFSHDDRLSPAELSQFRATWLSRTISTLLPCQPFLSTVIVPPTHRVFSEAIWPGRWFYLSPFACISPPPLSLSRCETSAAVHQITRAVRYCYAVVQYLLQSSLDLIARNTQLRWCSFSLLTMFVSDCGTKLERNLSSILATSGCDCLLLPYCCLCLAKA